MPLIGDTKRGKYWEIYIWAACLDCGKQRWVMKRDGLPQSPRCRKCAPFHRPPQSRGSANPAWRGGRRKNKDGYIEIVIQPENFFYPMVGKRSRTVLEHRLFMAQSLGRCLHPWEIVHHKNHIRDDNRIENLALVSDIGHKQVSFFEQKINKLETIIKEKTQEIKRLKKEFLK